MADLGAASAAASSDPKIESRTRGSAATNRRALAHVPQGLCAFDGRVPDYVAARPFPRDEPVAAQPAQQPSEASLSKRKRRQRAQREAVDAKHARGELTCSERRAARKAAHLERMQAKRAARAATGAASPAGGQPAAKGE